MSFADIAAGSLVFFDANIFVYHFEPHATYGAVCTELIERVERKDVGG